MPPAVAGARSAFSTNDEALSDAGAACEHAVQFYDDDSFLVQAVGEFLRAGIRAGEPALVVATPEHRAGFVRYLAGHGNDVDELIGQGRLVFLDAASTLARFMVAGSPDERRFDDVVGGALAAAHGVRKHRYLRAYGEMVDLLWRAENPDAAIRLEAIWNQLARRHSFTLLCGYAMDTFRHDHDGGRFAEVCRMHSRVVPTESFVSLADPDSQSREVSSLQQRARVLESEIERRKQTEDALRAALRVRDDFLCVAGHELRTPLTVLRLQLVSLLAHSDRGQEPRTERRLAALAKQTERLARLAERLLDVSQMGDAPSLHLRDVDLADLVRGSVLAAGDLATAAGCQVRLSTQDDILGRWDPDRIDQVVQDLLSNAFKFGAGTDVQVCVRGLAGHAEITVRDAGIGIPVADQQRIFERFERRAPSDSFGGLGLGLWIARQVVRAHGGELRVDSTPGSGATFTVSLPY